jgi:LysM repeat protein
LQRADLQLRRQKRFQKIVVATVATIAASLVVLLIEGCVSGHAKASTSGIVAETHPIKAAGAEPKPIIVLLANPARPLSAAPAASKQSAPSAVIAPETVYVVQPGDTLTRIAKQHRTTVKALKSVNGLKGDLLGVGMKLRLPTA